MDFADQNNLERICTLFDRCFFSGGAIPEGSFLCLALVKASQRGQTCRVTAVSVVKIYLQLIIIDKFITFELNKLQQGVI